MTFRPFTADWATALRTSILNDADYRAAASRWKWPVALVLDATPALGYPEPVAVEIALNCGDCTSAEIRSVEALTAPFVLRAPYETWKAIVRGSLDPLMAVTKGQVRVEGSLATLMMHARAATALVVCARNVPTHFPDEA